MLPVIGSAILSPLILTLAFLGLDGVSMDGVPVGGVFIAEHDLPSLKDTLNYNMVKTWESDACKSRSTLQFAY